jgi:hypothetical protein
MLARVVTFDGVTKERMDEMRGEIEGSDPPEGLNPKEMIALHDPESDKALVLILFENEDDYRRGDEVLSAMSTDDTPGQRTSVGRYDVAMRRTVGRRGRLRVGRRPRSLTRPGSPGRPGRARR